MHRILNLFMLLLIASSCTDDEPGDNDEFDNLLSETCWSEPDNDAKPIQEIYQCTTPMTFRIGTKYSFKYRIFTPSSYNSSTERFPLIIYLHGLDARGTDNNAQMNYAAYYFLAYNNQYPAFVVYPQCPIDAYWGLKKRPENFSPNDMELNPKHSYMNYGICQLIADLEKNYPIDSQRIYIAGHSMGGIGTLDFIACHPDVFAAALSFCGTINPNRFTTSQEVPLFILHNADDDVITVEGSRQTYRYLLQLGSEVVYHEGASGGHICWLDATKTPDMLEWLMSHSLSSRFGN